MDISELEVHENNKSSNENGDGASEKLSNIEIDEESIELQKNSVKYEPEKLYIRTLSLLKNSINEALEKEDDIEEPKSVQHRYKMACIKYKTFPLKNCTECLDNDLLDLSDLNIGPHAFRPLIDALLLSVRLTHLIIPGNRLGVKGLKYVSYLCMFNGNIIQLNLANNFIGPNSGDLIQQILIHGYNLEMLDLSDNGLEDEQLLAIVNALNNSYVHELNLNSNNFEGTVGNELGKCLSTNTNLRKLNLGFNRFGAGASGLFLGLRSNSCLQSLDLTGNGISEDSSPELGKALEANSSIEDLNLSYNKLNNDSMTHISKGIKTNNKLKILDLSFNLIRARGAQVLINCVAAADNKIEHLNLTGTRVNLPFLKTLNGILSSDRKIDVKYGNRLRYDLCSEHQRDLSKSSPLMQVLHVANGLGLNMKTELQKIHAKFLVDNRAQMELMKAENKEEADKPETNEDLEQNPRMKIDKFIQSLKTCPLKVSDELAESLANNFVSEKGDIDLGEIIVKIPLLIDILEFEPPLPTEPEPSKEKGKKKK